MEQEEDIININWTGLFQVLKEEKYRIGLVILIFSIIGVVIALTSRKEFVSEGKILPEYKKGGLSKYAGLASLAGVDLPTEGTDAVRPDLYPDVLKTTPFFLDLMKQKVMDKNNKEVVFEKFYKEKIEDGGGGISLFGSKKVDNPSPSLKASNHYIIVSPKEEARLKDLQQRISAVMDKKSGVLTISVKMPDPVVAASIAHYSMQYLVNYVIDYRTAKAKKDLDFYAEQMARAKGKYYSDQAKKAQYGDQFELSYIRLKAYDLQRERIESEYNVSSGFYKTLAQQYEQAKLKVQEETPVMKVLDPPRVPVKKSEPKSSLIAAGFFALGAILGLIWALLRKQNYKQVLG